MNKDNYTSLELSKKLHEAGCKLESDFRYDIDDEGFYAGESGFKVANWCYSYDILNDICVKYAKEMFGDQLHDVWHYVGNIEDKKASKDVTKEPKYITETTEILYLLQEGKKQELEEHIWDNCIFNNA